MSDTPRTDGIISGWIFGNATARLVDMSRTLERELANAIAERDSETRWADKYASVEERRARTSNPSFQAGGTL
jgi:hypothetical protein